MTWEVRVRRERKPSRCLTESLLSALTCGLTLLFLSAAPLAAQQAPAPAVDPHDPHAGVDATDLAKQTQNPVADLISIPLQFNFNGGGDLEDRTYFNLNVQPVIPFSVSENWKLILRTIVPFDSIPTPGSTRSTGVGDIQIQTFFTPA